MHSTTNPLKKVKKARVITFIRGSEFRNVNISQFPKRGLLLQHLRQLFSDSQLSFFVEPSSGEEVENFKDLKKSVTTVLVLDDSEDVEYVLYRYQKEHRRLC